MSFTAKRFLNTDAGPPGSGIYSYQSPDVRSLVLSPGYLNNNTDAQNLAEGDVIHVMGSLGGYVLEVLSISNSGDIAFYDHNSPSQGKTANVSGVVTEHTIYTNDLDPVVDNSLHPIYVDRT